MATIKFSAAIADARGSVGGVIFSRNRGGSYMKTKKKPVNPQTSLQQANRGLFGTLMSQWRALTEGERNTWIKNAVNYPVKNKIGETVTLTGAQLFVRCNMVLLNAALAPINNLPPAPVAMVKVSANQADATANPFEFDSVAGGAMTANFVLNFPEGAVPPNSAKQYIQIWSSQPVSSGISAVSSTRQQLLGSVGVAEFTQVAGTTKWTYDIGPMIDNKFGLGPSIYRADSQFTVRGNVYDETEGVSIPIGNQNYALVDIG